MQPPQLNVVHLTRELYERLVAPNMHSGIIDIRYPTSLPHFAEMAQRPSLRMQWVHEILKDTPN